MTNVKKILLICLLFSCIPGFGVIAEDEANNAGAYYLINEDFSLPQPNNYSAVAPSGWDISKLGGGVAVQGNKSFTVTDDSEILPVIMNKKFHDQEGEITFEFTLKLIDKTVDTRVELRQGETEAISLWFKENSMVAMTGSGEKSIAPINCGVIIGVKANVDVKKNTYTLWVNGKKVLSDESFFKNCSAVDNVNINSGDKTIGGFDIGTVRISRGFSVNERFLTSTYAIPDEWQTIGKAENMKVEMVKGGLYPDMYSLKIVDSNFLGSSGVTRKFTYDTEELWLEYQCLMPEITGDFFMDVGMDNETLISVGNRQNKFGYKMDGTFVPVVDFPQNIWNVVQVKLTKNGGEIWLNHKMVKDKIKLPYLKVNCVSYYTGKVSTGTMWVDDFIVKGIYPTPTDYVPAPILPEKNEFIVGMQSCSMWKEGSHFGWDWINPFPERHSYMGFYDEGSPEVKDWEIKWMLEHGIDYELYCWYRPPDGNNVPIKFPRNAYALHDGYFNATYSNLSKFAIAWENGGVGVSGSADFRQNVVPYWIEQYFKDPRYMVVDNKPVISIYTLNGLKGAFGTLENIKVEMDYLRSACVNAGFDGAYILLTSSSKTINELEDIKKAGIDCIYNYSWGGSAGIVETQMKNLEDIRSIGGVDKMMTLSMGRDDTPWERSSGTFSTVEDFGRLVQWGMKEYVPSLPSDIGKRFVMFGNWNEYGEGHFLSPCEMYGFGYLDEIRKAFTKPSAHEDVRPTEHQKERINHMYLQDRKRNKPYVDKKVDTETVPQNVKLGYYFEDGTDGFTVAKQVENFGAKDGAIYGTSVSSDPGVYSPSDMDLVIGDVTYIRLKMKVSNETAELRIYFITDDSTNWAEGKGEGTTFKQEGDEFMEVLIPVANNSSWKGKLKQLRIDPLVTVGDFQIDSIEFLSPGEVGTLKMEKDGERQFFKSDIFVKNDTLMVPARELCDILEFSWETSLDGVSLDIAKNNKKFVLPYGKKTATAGGKEFIMPEAACLVESQAYFPLRAVVEQMGYKIEWDEKTNTANIVTSKKQDQKPVVSYPTDPLGSFNFHEAKNLQGWSPNSVCNKVTVQDDVLSFQAAGTDPMFNKGITFKAQDFSMVKIRIKNPGQGTTFQLFFGTDKEPNFSESKTLNIDIEPGSNEFKEYSISTSQNEKWDGTITSLRMDPTNNLGKIELDYLILSNEKGGSVTTRGANLISGGVMDNKALNFKTQNAVAEYEAGNGYIGRYSLAVKNDGAEHAVIIPINLIQDHVYEYEFWVKLPQAGEVGIGTTKKDSKKEMAKVSVASGGTWQKISGTFTQGEQGDGIYLFAGAKAYYIDAITLREVK